MTISSSLFEKVPLSTFLSKGLIKSIPFPSKEEDRSAPITPSGI